MSDFTVDGISDMVKAKQAKLARLRERKAQRERKKAAGRAEMERKKLTAKMGTDPLDVTVKDKVPDKPKPQATSKPKTAPTSLAAKSDELIKSLGLPKPQKKVVLKEVSGEFNHNVQPEPRVISYSKGIQIELETPAEANLQKELDILRSQLRGVSTETQAGPDPQTDENKTKEIKSIEEERAEEKAFQEQLIPNAERKRIMRSDKFLKFFRGSTTVMERALTQNEDYDVTIDYSKREETEDAKEEATISKGPSFSDGMRTNLRAVTSVTWSNKHHDLFLVSYAEQQNLMSMDPDGLVNVWSTHTPSRPEYTLTCQSTVLVAQFHPVKPNIVIAGTKSGQVIVWNLGVKSTPVNRTSLSQGHTHPVYAMSTVPAVNKAHSILSISTDGHVCIWQDTDHLEEPSLELDLQWVGRRSETKDRDITTTSFGFVGRDSNALILGSDEGVLYKARIYEGPSAAPGIHSATTAHAAPISNVCFRPPIKGLPTLMSELYLTSSFDWTTKLWHTKTRKPLYTFERCRDYVYDIQWSPVHPAVFATGDGNGLLDVWNLNLDPELPTQSIQATEQGRTISKISFSSDGRSIAVGSSSGSVQVFQLHDTLAVPSEEDAKKFYEAMQKRLQEITQRQNAQMENVPGRYQNMNYSSLGSISSILNSGVS